MDLDLVKKVELVLEKKGFKKVEAKVCIILDESGSMKGLFQDGTVSRTVDRALAIGYKFDDDGEIDVWSFAGHGRFMRRAPATQEQYGSYLKHSMLGGSTVYHQVLSAVANDYFGPRTTSVTSKEPGFLGKLFGKKAETVTEVVDNDNTLPAFVAFITDGRPDNDREATDGVLKVLRENPKLFVQFIGIGSADYSTLKNIASLVPNAAFDTIEAKDSDDVVLDKFLNEKARKVLEQ